MVLYVIVWVYDFFNNPPFYILKFEILMNN